MVDHRRSWARLGLGRSKRRQLLRNMVTSLIQHERIVTTHPKAKAAQRMADRMVTLAKENTPRSRMRALAYIYDKECVKKLFVELAQRYAHRPSGYTRVTHVNERQGDDAPMSILEFIDRQHGIREVRKPVQVSEEENEKRKALRVDYEKWSQMMRI